MFLKQRYNINQSTCCLCGKTLKSQFGEPLGHYFVMDTNGNFYCYGCDTFFNDAADERIYVLEDDE